MDCVHIIFLDLIVTTLQTTLTNSYNRRRKNNVNNLDCVHIIFLDFIVPTLTTSSNNSFMVRSTIETKKIM
jgi:hypothetical protein